MSALVGVGLLLVGCSKEEEPLEQLAPTTVIVTKQALPEVLNNWHGVGLMAVQELGERTLTVSEKVLKEGDAEGRRLACEDGLHPCPWRPLGSQARQRPGCMGNRHKPWQGLPVPQ